MNGNQITFSVNTSELNQLRSIARTRGQSVADYVAQLISSKLATPNPIPSQIHTALQESHSKAG